MDFFLSRELYEPNNQDDLGLFIAEPNRETSSCGLQLEGVKIESIDEYELTFDHKVTFDVSYEALLTIMEYVREYCTLS